MLVRCPSTVFGDTNSAAATCLVWRPSATSSATRRSAAGELAGGGDSAAHARQLVAGPFRPDRRAHLLEGRLRRFERFAGRPLLPSPALGRPRAPGATARAPAGSARPRSERPLRPAPPTRRRARRVPPGAARGNACRRQRGRPLEGGRIGREPREQLLGLIEPPDPHQRLDLIWDHARAWLRRRQPRPRAPPPRAGRARRTGRSWSARGAPGSPPPSARPPPRGFARPPR